MENHLVGTAIYCLSTFNYAVWFLSQKPQNIFNEQQYLYKKYHSLLSNIITYNLYLPSWVICVLSSIEYIMHLCYSKHSHGTTFPPESDESTERTLELELLQAELRTTGVTNAISCTESV